MGVHGLWPLLHPVARPVALETMGGKKLAIDSSIWLYQFQIAMRDKDGRALDNAHILGFLRRICKLLFYGIKPVFVFDGGAPLIKKIAISNRKNRKRGAKETAAKTAEKLLAAQLRAAAVAQAQKTASRRETGDVVDENANYLDEDYGVAPRGAPERRPRPLNQDSNAQETTPPKKKYVHRDQYALPAIDGSLQSKALPADHRLATEAELRSFIEDMRPEDFDMESEFFANLPVEVKYEIIGDLRIKSRQVNMKRVEAMRNAPTALDFSKAQILNLSHRNDLTQKLLTVTDSLSRTMQSVPVRIAGERNREYVLIKNESGSGAGYVLGLKDDGKTATSPVKIDITTTDESDAGKTSTDDEFEQVEIPKIPTRKSRSPDPAHRQEMALEAIKQKYSPVKLKERNESPDDLLDDQPVRRPQKPLFSSNNGNAVESSDLFADIQEAVRAADEREDLKRAIEASREGFVSESNEGDESDESFDEVITDPLPNKQVPEQDPSSHTAVAHTRTDKSGDHYVTVPPIAKKKSPTFDISSGTSPSRSTHVWKSEKDISASNDKIARSPVGIQGPPSLHIDIPRSDYKPPSPAVRGHTPRPDLTYKQAERDTSPQYIASNEGVIERDYAPQPSSPVADRAPSTTAIAPGTTKASSPYLSANAQVASEAVGPSKSPSLLTRRLSTQSQRQRSPSPVQWVIPDANDILRYGGSQADDLAVREGTISVADELRQESAVPEQVRNKGDLQVEVEEGNIFENKSPHAAVADAAPSQAGSPEVFYEWSPSPEPVARKRPTDATLLPPHDPNYIPPDIEFPDAEEDLVDEDADDLEHVVNVTSEQKEYAKFLSELKNKNLDEMEYEVQNELRVLNEQNKKDRAMADDITQQMAKDIQTMLRVLGLPYVVAPMEAEAQCAELLARNLVDGVITDDNDVFLFGATRVYKNMFNQNKYVECYLASDIDRELALNREKLIRLAYFLGSDYCDGLPGVGPVLGMELMAEFPGSEGHIDFRNWWLKVQRGRDTPDDHPTAFRRKFKKSKKELFIDDNWPDPLVADAYLHPTVDESDEAFSWGIPDLDALRDFLKENLGWGPAKVDELMLPIIRKMTGRAAGNAINQSTINSFFDVSGGTGRFAPMGNKGYQSKRLQNVVKAWRQSQQQLAKEEDKESSESEREARPRAGRVNSKKGKRRSSGSGSHSRRGSHKPSPASSRSLSRQHSRQGETNLSEDSDANYHEKLEARLEKMGVKRKREAPIGSSRIIEPAKRSKKEAARSNAAKARRSQSTTKKPLFAAADSDEEDDENYAVQTSCKSSSRSATRRKRAVGDDDDEYVDRS